MPDGGGHSSPFSGEGSSLGVGGCAGCSLPLLDRVIVLGAHCPLWVGVVVFAGTECCSWVWVVFTGPVHRTEKNCRTKLNQTMVQSIFWLWLPGFGAIPVASCQVSKIF